MFTMNLFKFTSTMITKLRFWYQLYILLKFKLFLRFSKKCRFILKYRVTQRITTKTTFEVVLTYPYINYIDFISQVGQLNTYFL